MRTQPYTGLDAAPDSGSLARLHRLQHAGLSAVRGLRNVVGVDRGDPVIAFNGPLKATPNAANAIGRVGNHVIYVEPATYDDTISQDASLDPYRAGLLERLTL